MVKTVLITGTTSGIGKACALRFAKEGYRIIITGRRRDRLSQLKDDLQHLFHVDVLLLEFDVRNRKRVEEVIQGLPEDWKTIDILINNAGLAAGLDFIQSGSIDDWEQMIDTNIKGLLYMSRAVSNLMINKGSGHIINIGSIAGKEVYAKGNVYCGTKYAVDAITKGMRIDLVSHGVKVSQVCPGAVETEFSLVRFKWDEQAAASVYKGFTPLSGEDVAEAVYWIASQPAHVNINDMVIMPTAQASTVYWHKQ